MKMSKRERKHIAEMFIVMVLSWFVFAIGVWVGTQKIESVAW